MIKRIKTIMLIMCVLVLAIQHKVQANAVEYRGELGGLISTQNDFFLNLGELLPGDTKEDVAYIKNSTKDEIEVFFKTEPLEQAEYYDEIDYSLLEKIKLKISLKQTSNSEEKVLYEGNLGAELMSKYISLGEYNKGYDGEFIFKIEVPTELRNDYTLSTTKVKWVFAVEKKETEVKSAERDDDDKPIFKQIVDKVTTGDNIYYAVIILILAIVIGIASVLIKKKSDRKNNKKIEK